MTSNSKKILVVLFCFASLNLATKEAHAAPLSFGTTTVSLVSPAIDLTIASGSVADILVISSDTVTIGMSSSTGGTFLLLSPQIISTSTTGTLGAITSTCSGGIFSISIAQPVATATYTLMPTGSVCLDNNSGSEGSGNGSGGDGVGGEATAQLSISESVNNPHPNIGDTIAFSITISGKGPSTSPNVIASDTLPSGLTLVSSTSTQGSYSNGIWTVGNVGYGQRATLILTAIVNSDASEKTLSNIITVSEANGVLDPLLGSGYTSASATINVAGVLVSNGGLPITNMPSSTLGTSTQSLQSEIASLMSVLQALIAEANKDGISLQPGMTVVGSGTTFTRDLSLGMSGVDVHDLQKFLIKQNAGPAARQLEKHGTTQYFGILTKNALAEFQKKNGIRPASGYFGPITRAWIKNTGTS